MSNTSVTTSALSFQNLRALRPGAMVKCTLRGGRVITGRLLELPQLVCVGKPGLNRIQLVVRDVAVRVGDNASYFTACAKGRHTVGGHKVTEILTA